MAKKQGQPAAFSKLEDVKRYILGGSATFTLVSVKTGTRFTYRVTLRDVTKDENGHVHFGKAKRSSSAADVWFVDVLTGPDNTNDYSPLGTIWRGTSFGALSTEKNPRAVGSSAPSSQAFDFFWRELVRGRPNLLDHVEVWHQGACSRCGHPLTVPESIARGMGPDCASR